MSRSPTAGVTVAVLAGGLGTRLRGVVGDRPKVLAQVNGRPFLTYLLDQIVAAGFADVVLCTGYRADAVQAQFGPDYGPLQLRYSCEHQPLGTGGALRHAIPLLKARTVLVLNGDSFVDADLGGFCRWHARAPSRGSLLLVQVPDVGRYGQVEFSPDGTILAFREKQTSAGAGWINGGIYLLERDWLQSIPPRRLVSLERECFPQWLSRPLRARAMPSRFIDIGTPESYRQAEEFFKDWQPSLPDPLHQHSHLVPQGAPAGECLVSTEL